MEEMRTVHRTEVEKLVILEHTHANALVCALDEHTRASAHAKILFKSLFCPVKSWEV
jgi:hypothetical protein